MKWTSEQQKVIDFRGENLLVSAAAGSGKTAVLVERIIKMITDEKNPVGVDRLLVMTFTKAAASEMKERISASLREKIKKDKDNRYLKLQAALLPRAKIATIDSICSSLIKQNYQSLNIDPSFRVADEGELKLLKNNIIKELLEEKYKEKDEAFTELSEMFSGGGGDGELSDIILKMHEFISSYPFSDMFFDKISAETEKERNKELENLPWTEYMLSEIRETLSEYGMLLNCAKELCALPDGPEKYSENVEEALAILHECLEARGYEELRDAFNKASFGRLKVIRAGSCDEEMKEAVKNIRNGFKDEIKELKEDYMLLPYEELRECMRKTAVPVSALTELAKAFSERFSEAKAERNILDFGDLEHMALKLLWEKGSDGELRTTVLADRLAQSYAEILIDEYQDSNMVQEYLLKALSAERFGRPDVFMVGDVKQSIYRFRLAKPEIFMEKYENYGADGKNHVGVKTELNKNFRSRGEVLSSVNDLFMRIMRKSLGGVEYDENAALKEGASYPDSREMNRARGFSPFTELLLVTEADTEISDKDGEQGPAKDNADGEAEDDFTALELEAALIARKITELMSLSDREKAFMVYDRKKDVMRPVEYRDIAILMRSPAGRAEKLVNILSFSGIPAYAETATGYFNAREVEVMLSMLDIIDNPLQDIPLTAVLKSPVGGFSDEELGLIRGEFYAWKENISPRSGGMYETLLFAAGRFKEEGLREPAYRKAFEFLRLLEDLRDFSKYRSVSELILEIYERTGYYDYAAALPLGNIRKANLNMLFEKAESYSKTSFKGLFNFVRYIEQLKKYDTDYGEASVYSEEDNIVRITSIHKSKGLEYPVVILAGLQRPFNRNDRREKLILDSELGIGVDYTDTKKRIRYPGLKKAVIKRKLKTDGLGEELRVLYVAMTRAKEKLIMTAAVKDAEKKLLNTRPLLPADLAGVSADKAGERKLLKTELLSAGSYLDWILAGYRENRANIEMRVISAKELRINAEDRAVDNADRLEPFKNINREEIYDRELRSELLKNRAFTYKFREETELYPKKSVSEIKHEYMDADFDDNAREEMKFEEPDLSELSERLREGKKVYAGAARGSAYHRVFELLDFRQSCDRENIREQTEKMLAGGKLSKEEEKYINRDTILALCESETGRIMSEAARKGRLYRERRFMIGRPARELSEGSSSDELQLLQGIIDAYVESDEGIVLIDYKTDRIRAAEGDGAGGKEAGEEELKRKYRIQLELYAEALEQLTGKKVKEKIIYSTELGRSIKI